MTNPTFRILAGAVFAGLALAAPAPAQDVIVSPDTELRVLLREKLSGRVPDFDELARRSAAVRQADEFSRAGVLAEEVARLNRVWAGLGEDIAIQVSLSTYLGEYDADASGFPITPFEPGTYVSGEVPILFRNAAARIFPVPMEAGRETLDRAGIARSVTVTVTLEDLAASEIRSNTIDGRIAEVVVTNEGSELGRYSPEGGMPAEGAGATMDADAVARSLGGTLGVPVAGSAWDEVLPFLLGQPATVGTGGNFSGILFSITDGALRTERPLDQYSDLTLAFGPTENAAKLALREATDLFGGFGPSWPFGGLDCGTPDVADRCGLIRFEKAGEVDVLVDVVTVAELPGVRYDTAAAVEPFDAEAIASMRAVETVIGYTSDELGGTRGRAPVGVRVHYAGDLRNEPLPLHDPLAGMSSNFSAKTMLWVIDGQGERTVYLTRSSLP